MGEIKWWEDWLEADLLEREKMMKKLPIIKDTYDLAHSVDKKTFEFSLRTLLRSYFEDLENELRK